MQYFDLTSSDPLWHNWNSYIAPQQLEDRKTEDYDIFSDQFGPDLVLLNAGYQGYIKAGFKRGD
jgi:hypothetical protein